MYKRKKTIIRIKKQETTDHNNEMVRNLKTTFKTSKRIGYLNLERTLKKRSCIIFQQNHT